MKKAVIIVGIVLVLGFAYYAISPLFINIEADEALPTPQITGGEDSETVGEPAQERGEVVGTVGHPAEGYAYIVNDGQVNYVRYEDFKTINGPDIFVYLAKDLDAKDFVNLGRVKATEGNVNYEIPVNVDPNEYRYVLTWCRAFGVLFNYAELP